jgi:hypothetical protein
MAARIDHFMLGSSRGILYCDERGASALTGLERPARSAPL